MTALLQSLPPASNEADLQEVAAVLRDRLGVRVQSSLRPELQEALLAARRFGRGGDPAEIARHLREAPDADPLLAHFVQALSVGETSFYRNPPQLEALVSLTMAEIVPQRRARGLRLLRVFSAGCATGEEVYTLAALFSAAAPDFLVHVVGADFNARALAIAREGIYPEHSVRGELPLALERHLTRVGGPGRGWRVSEALKAKVGFVPLNLALDPLPNPDRGLYGFDVVLCRNVLIYVDEARLPEVMRKLAASAVERCIVGVGPAEYRVATHLPGFQDRGQALLLRTGAQPVAAPVIRLPTPEASSRRTRPAPSPPPQSPRTPAAVLPRVSAPADTERLLAQARRFADDGRMAEAWTTLDALLAAAPDASDAHLLAAALHDAAGDYEAAATAYRRALFLDDRSVAAELGLGECHARLGRAKEARRAFWRALRLLEGRDPGETIAALDLPAIAVRRLAQQRLFQLEDA